MYWKKGFEYYRRRFPNAHFITEYQHLYANTDFELVSRLADRLMVDFNQGTFDQIELYYSRFKNAGTQFPEREQYLPVAKLATASETASQTRADYILNPINSNYWKN